MDIMLTTVFLFILFGIGLWGVITKTNYIFQLLSVEIMLNAANAMFVYAFSVNGSLFSSVAFLFVVTIAACEVAIGLALLVIMYKNYKQTDTSQYTKLKG
jgi:NADH-quinone oxidoreductase subunit K